MPNRCSVFGCRSNYDKKQKYVPTFSLPKKEPLRTRWILRLRTNFANLKHPVVCVKHFEESDIVWKDVLWYKGELKEYPRIIPKLKEGAVPCIFPSTSHVGNRTPPLLDTSDEVGEKEAAVLKSLLEEFEKDTISSISDVCDYVTGNLALSNWTSVRSNETVNLIYVSDSECPDILANIFLTSTLDISVYVRKVRIDNKELPGSVVRLNSYNVLEEVMDFVEKNVLIYVYHTDPES